MVSEGHRATGDQGALLLGIDVGTSRLKIAVYDGGLRLVRASSRDTAALTGSRKGQWDAERLWEALKVQLADLLKLVPAPHVVGVGITGMAESGCLVDADSRPITPILLWHDRRGIRQAAAL